MGAAHDLPWIETIDKNVVDGVFLCLPNTQHAPYAIAAAEQGLHVICEKPMAPSLEECQKMIDAAHANKVLAAAHCMVTGRPNQSP